MNEGRIDAALEAELERRAGRTVSRDGTHLQVAEQAEVDSLVEIADLLWEAADHDPPPLEDDPTAIVLGLVPDPAITLDAGALRRCRKDAGLKTSELAARLAERGWPVATLDVFAWETKSANGLCPALIRAIAETLDCQVEDVTAQTVSVMETALDKVAKAPWFVGLAWQWAGQLDITFGAAQSALLGHMTATATRGSDLTELQWREVLEHLEPHSPNRPSVDE
ncbi:MAG: hypothetical protein FWG11_08210 [Promicromonosporaceae bacterium]|nr:hypothetical protein [Promicromonosporaceae bacterium]